jgi:DNA-binding transcriptional LysR family regulator
MRNLDITALRSFVAVAQAGGVTRASGFLNLTQSAVSMQLKRLEELLGLELLERSGRGVALTAAGDRLLSYAKRMVELNDEVFAQLTEQAFEGEIALGVPVDIVYPAIPQVLQRFNSELPKVKVQLVSSYTKDLKRSYARGEVDVILTTEEGVEPGGETLGEVALRWVGAPDGSVSRQSPLRVAFCRFCGFREKALRELDEGDIAWEMAVMSDSDRTVEASVSADLGVTAMLDGHAPPHLDYLAAGPGLPDLGMQKINMYSSAAPTEVVLRLKDMIRQAFATL